MPRETGGLTRRERGASTAGNGALRARNPLLVSPCVLASRQCVAGFGFRFCLQGWFLARLCPDGRTAARTRAGASACFQSRPSPSVSPVRWSVPSAGRCSVARDEHGSWLALASASPTSCCASRDPSSWSRRRLREIQGEAPSCLLRGACRQIRTKVVRVVRRVASRAPAQPSASGGLDAEFQYDS